MTTMMMTRLVNDVRRGRASQEPPEGESGFALILAILALLLLTFLGLSLMTSTSSEYQIAINYQIGQQALYNAEAGIESGKILLSTMNWPAVLPAARVYPVGTGWTGDATPVKGSGLTVPFPGRLDAWGNAARNFEGGECDKKGAGYGYGVVLDDGTAQAPFQYKTAIMGQNLNGAFTLWIRRPLKFRDDGTLEDSSDDTQLVLVAEGIAPFAGSAATTAFARGRQARQLIEVTYTSSTGTTQGNQACMGRSGQVGGGPLGANFGGCEAIAGGGAVTQALPSGTATGGGTEIDANQ